MSWPCIPKHINSGKFPCNNVHWQLSCALLQQKQQKKKQRTTLYFGMLNNSVSWCHTHYFVLCIWAVHLMMCRCTCCLTCYLTCALAVAGCAYLILMYLFRVLQTTCTCSWTKIIFSRILETWREFCAWTYDMCTECVFDMPITCDLIHPPHNRQGKTFPERTYGENYTFSCSKQVGKNWWR